MAEESLAEDSFQEVVRKHSSRVGMTPEDLEQSVLEHLFYTCGKDLRSATPLDVFRAIAHATRDRLVQRWLQTKRTYFHHDIKRVCYLSAEFLIGRALAQNLHSLGIFHLASESLKHHGLDLNAIFEEELDPGLGNGGLGRLAACFMDSLATLQYPGYGYGIRYEFGIFDQLISNGWQIERGDDWLRRGNPWEIARHELSVLVNFYGRVETRVNPDGSKTMHWVDTQTVVGVPYDTPVLGYQNNTVNTLRLWSARASKEFNFSVFNDGDYRRAVEEKALSESISKVLYPNDQSEEGKELRLKQQYFFVACSISDILRRYKKRFDGFENLPNQVAIQLNDTHPAVAVAELMRVLIDLEGLTWEKAWEITKATTGFTNHTLLPEALEKWPVATFERLLPRILQIIYEINRRFLLEVHVRWPNEDARKARMSIIEEGPIKNIRMAHLAVAGSHSVNGVARLHSELVKSQLMPDFYELWPDRFNNKTNGVTPRRWLVQCNPALAEAITKRIGSEWICDLQQLVGLLKFAKDPEFRTELQTIKRANKKRLADVISERHGFSPNLESIFDVQVKRLHEYKRQLLCCLHIVALYQELKEDPNSDIVPRTFVFGGKAAPGYVMAKLHIKLINDVAAIINHDPIIQGKLRVVFLSNYNVSLAEIIIPGSDLSEQISMAGKEASGTGNMKFAMNGALTVGTLDGANIEIREEVGEDNFFLFGLHAHEVRELKASGYDPKHYIERSPRLRRVLELIYSGFFCPDDPARFHSVVNELRNHDTYMLCADFDDYWRSQREVDATYRDQELWTDRVIQNLAHVGKFSSDRTIEEYCQEIWKLKPCPIDLEASIAPSTR